MTYAKRYARSGFTLIELMVVIAILGILAAVALPAYLRYQRQAQMQGARTTLRLLQSAITNYQTEIGQFPTTLRDLIRRPREERLAKKWEEPYLIRKEIAPDPWKNRYNYKVTPTGANPYELYSYGPKGKGAPKAEWISVWDD